MSDITFNTKSLRRAVRLASTLAQENEELLLLIRATQGELAASRHRLTEVSDNYLVTSDRLDEARSSLEDTHARLEAAIKERDAVFAAIAEKDAEIADLRRKLENKDQDQISMAERLKDQLASAPEWVRVDVRLPEKDGYYYVRHSLADHPSYTFYRSQSPFECWIKVPPGSWCEWLDFKSKPAAVPPAKENK